MKEIKLTNSELVALVDDEDYERVNQYKWHISKDNRTDYFTVKGGPNKGNLYLHRFILGLGKTIKVVDHKDRNTLNNQRSNLRLVTQRENVLNSKRREKGLVYIYVKKRYNPDNFSVVSTFEELDCKYFGTFATYEEAVLARDMEMVKHFGINCSYLINDINTILTSEYPVKLTKGEGAKKSKGIPKIESRTYERPSKEELHKLIWSKSTIKIAKDIGCSDKCIEKWCKTYGLTKPPRGFWQQLEANKFLNQSCPIEGL